MLSRKEKLCITYCPKSKFASHLKPADCKSRIKFMSVKPSKCVLTYLSHMADTEGFQASLHKPHLSIKVGNIGFSHPTEQEELTL